MHGNLGLIVPSLTSGAGIFEQAPFDQSEKDPKKSNPEFLFFSHHTNQIIVYHRQDDPYPANNFPKHEVEPAAGEAVLNKLQVLYCASVIVGRASRTKQKRWRGKEGKGGTSL